MKKRLKLIYIGNQLSKHGFTPTSVETLGMRLEEDFEVIRASSFRNMGLRLLHMWLTILKYRKSDYLLVDTYSTSAFFFAQTSGRLARWLGLPYIPILHGGALPERARESPKQLKKYLSGAFKVVCPSSFLKEELHQIIPLEYTVIPNAINQEDYQLKLRNDLSKAFKILWVRSFHSTYNPQLAVKTLKLLHDRGYDQTSLCMVGPDKDGSLEKVQTLALQMGVEKYLTITGKMSKKDWLVMASEYDIFLNTTNVDNTPVSVIEAMALGLPVVSTNVGGLSYFLEHGQNALLVPPDDEATLVEAILSLRVDNTYAELSATGSKTARSYFWSHVREQWKTILQ